MEIDRNLGEGIDEDDEKNFDKEFKNKNVDDVKDKKVKSPRKKRSGKKKKAGVKKLVNTEQPSPEDSSETVDDEAEAGPSHEPADKAPFKPFVLNYEEYNSNQTDSTSQDESNKDADKPLLVKDSDTEDKKHTTDSNDDTKEDDITSETANEESSTSEETANEDSQA